MYKLHDILKNLLSKPKIKVTCNSEKMIHIFVFFIIFKILSPNHDPFHASARSHTLFHSRWSGANTPLIDKAIANGMCALAKF